MIQQRLLTALALSAACLGASSCTSIGKALAGQPVPAYGVDERLASAMGCDLVDIQHRGERYKRESYDAGGPGYVVPSVGDTSCDVLAKLGRPDDSETVSTEAGEAMQFWYRTGTAGQGNVKMHLVVLEEAESRGAVVTSVVW